jgi:3',5'-cyclic AMP phosphodiesterase CpdA
MRFKVGHVTDIHLHNWSDLRLRDFISKRLTGFANFQLRRRGEYREEVLAAALNQLVQEDIELLIVSGDLSNLGLRSEFQHAREFIEKRVPETIPKIVVPGNHDRYTPDTADGRFEEIYEGWMGEPCSEDLAWPRYYEKDGWCFLLVDSSLPTPWFEAWGEIGDEALTVLDDFMTENPVDARHFVIVVHHHPSIALYKRRERKRNLRDAQKLREIASKHHTELILHGHNHHYDIRRMQDAEETVIFGLSSSISSKAKDPRTSGQYALHTFDDEGVVENWVASWNGTSFSTIERVEPDEVRTESPAEVPSAQRAT